MPKEHNSGDNYDTLRIPLDNPYIPKRSTTKASAEEFVDQGIPMELA